MTSTCRGIDVSAYQASMDWAALKSDGLSFAFAKASEGQNTRDARFAAHIKGIKAAGLIAGAYHFAWPNQDPAREAANYIAAVRPHAGPGFLHWLDLEAYSDRRNYRGRTAEQIRAYAAAWIAAVQKAFPGQRVGIYTSADDIAHGHVPTGVPLWYPAYPGARVDTFAEAEAASRPTPSGRTVTIWQFTSTPAKGPRVDSNLCYMSASALRTWAAGDTAPSKPSTPKPYSPPPFPSGLAPNKARPSAVTLQRALKKAGHMAKSVPESPNYGPKTQAAVAKFHNAHPQYRAAGKSYDPAIGPKGWAALFRLAYGK
ncbi:MULTISPECIES: glycoside hydrolase family 25 protein [Streptomyces]|uniref:N-acetylmuramoyl-L-alanine amidase n=1 Tax=Streptomyces dengpaensis TaxID=2049881 RepID=A0ABM6SUI2_9ACTN|nr:MULTISPECIES: glycoside hydrolase family 25 protein [Streptomyces]AVH58373.1 N-acetylmuramoyl-L-alanine amidase [Streptomyces dengpaensis]PIB06048.1 N-acetylmuramoyl-L-alanine amidase [Streptomyces sp. HG99]